jgi:phosphorylcholine metabolism protein LicD
MDNLTERLRRIRWGPLQQRRRRGLRRLHDVLAQTGFHNRYWMAMGMLLGCIRDGEPMPGDPDADFGFLEKDLKRFRKAMGALQDKEFRLRPVSVNNDGTESKWAFRYQGVKYEFYLFRTVGSRLRWYYHARKPSIEVVNEIDAHNLSEIDLYGRRWLKPEDHEVYLEALYGDWRTPDPQYCYWKDCQATIIRRPWTGVQRRRVRSTPSPLRPFLSWR